jgi:hypothetical protein
MPRPSHTPWFHHPNNIWWSVNIMEFLIMQFSQASFHFSPLRSKYCIFVSTGSPRFTRTRYTLFRLYAILSQRSIFTQVAVQGGVCKDGWPIFHLRFNLKSHCSITLLHSHKNCRVSLKKEGLDLRDFGIGTWRFLGTHLSRKTRTACTLFKKTPLMCILPLTCETKFYSHTKRRIKL